MDSQGLVRGDLKNALVQTHPTLRLLDKGLGWAMMGGMVTLEFITFAVACIHFADGVSAAETMHAAACVCSFTIAVLAFIVWHSCCYYDTRMRKLMKYPTKLTPDGFMRVGFVPIPAAASVGLLLFVTSAFVSPALQPGSMLQQAGAGVFLPWLPGMTCTASSQEEPDYLTRWGARLDRIAPSTMADRFNLLIDPFATEPGYARPGSCFKSLFDFGMDDVINPITGKDRDITNLVSPQGDTTGRLCMYECVSWQTITLQTVLSNLGAITVGAAIVVEMTQYVSSKLGLPTVTGDTSPKELGQLFQRIGAASSKTGKAAETPFMQKLLKPFQASMFGCALPILVVGSLLKYVLVVKLDADGFDTVDYYTTYALVYSVAMVTLLRLWHPFECRPQIYTKKLWHDGVDTFIVVKSALTRWNELYGEGEFVKVQDVGCCLALVNIDLYQWMHLRGKERNTLLINRCRRPVQGGASNAQLLVCLDSTDVKVKHTLQINGEEVRAEKAVHLPAGTEMTVVSWKDAEHVNVKVTIQGKEEEVTVSRLEVLEKSKEWEDLEKEWDLMAWKSIDLEAEENAAGSPSKPSAPNLSPGKPGGSLKQKLLCIEQRLESLEPGGSPRPLSFVTES